MNGTLNQEIINLFKTTFEEKCTSLLFDAYTSVVSSNRKLNEEDENNITAQLVGFMMKNPLRSDWEIHLARESYLDTDETYDGLKDADESPRIDIKYTTWNSKSEFEYYMEAKNLAENNWTKNSTGAFVDAKKLRKRYIDTGIANFTSGRYPNGCLIGYVLEGKIPNVIKLLNDSLILSNRKKEVLNSDSNYYVSKHDGTSMPQLKHFMLHLP